MPTAATVANRFLALATERENALTPMQILKLVYIAHGWMLGLYGRPLINDEIQAWQYGPVIPSLYEQVRRFRSRPVEGPLAAPPHEHLSAVENGLVEQVYNIYGTKSGPSLSRLTHAAGTPWALTYRPGEFGIEIPNDIIEDHYSRLANDPQGHG